MILLDGKKTAEHYYAQWKKIFATAHKKPTLAVILVGKDPASAIYVKNKELACEKAGIQSISIHFPAETREETILHKIQELNNDATITGIIVQVPLPKHISAEKVIMAINPKKDADGFHPHNIGNMYLSAEKEHLAPATPKGIIMMLENYTIPLEGKHVVVVGRSNNVGKAIALMCLNRNATVTICHSKTINLEYITRQADIIIAAVGKPHFITADMVSENAVVIDVGIHKQNTGQLCGDVDFALVSKKVQAISPVPGGVGPMTVAALLANTIKIFTTTHQ